MLALACVGTTACDDNPGPTPASADKTPASADKTPASADKEKPQAGRKAAEAEGSPAADAKVAPVGDDNGEETNAGVDAKTLLNDNGTYHYGKDAFGELTDGLADKDVLAKLGEPKNKDGRMEEGATGDIIQQWYYPDQGITLTMRSQTMTSAQSVGGMTIKAPCAFKTKLGIGIGSTRADVLATYGAFKDPEFPAGPDQFIAGSVYGGVFFDFSKDKVVSMFMGAGAE